jgi:hypothetical protein
MARGRLIVWLGLIIGIAIPVNGSAAAADLYPPSGFQLPASNGYSIHGIAFDGDARGERDAVLLFVGRKGSSAVYSVRRGASVTETTISADLGAVGRIDLHFVPNGESKAETIPCSRKPIEFQAGHFVGSFVFEGEEGFAAAHRGQVRGEMGFVVGVICGQTVNEGFGGHSPGARLLARRKEAGGWVVLEATKNSPNRPSRFQASIEEKRRNLMIARGVGAIGGASAFEFDVPAQTAALKPPSPFEGSAKFLHIGEQGHLRGNLSVDFPGRSNVSLAGTRGSLSRYVANPSHPFRPLLSSPLARITLR